MAFWHKMADEQPKDENGKYLLLGKRRALKWMDENLPMPE